MASTTQTNAPKVRRDAAKLVIQRGLGVRMVARRYGVSPGTVSKWVQKARKIGSHPIPTHTKLETEILTAKTQRWGERRGSQEKN